MKVQLRPYSYIFCRYSSHEQGHRQYHTLLCTGGSPLQNFSGGKKVPEHEKSFSSFFQVLNVFWTSWQRIVRYQFLLSCPIPTGIGRIPDWHLWFRPGRAIIHACAMGIEAGPGLPIKKAFRIMTSSEDLSRRVSYRFRCNCDFHAPFNFTDFQLSEKYSRKFARFFVRMLALLALESGERSSCAGQSGLSFQLRTA